MDILTGQHVTIAYRPASIFERGFAVVLDWIIQYLYIMLLLLVYAESGVKLFNLSNVDIVIITLASAPIVLYNFFFEAFMQGQTPGKVLLKVKIVNVDGSATSVGNHFLRWLLRPVDFFPLLGIFGAFFVFFTNKKQRIGDLAAGTVVVKTTEKVNIGAEYYEFEENYTPLYPQVEKLSEKQIQLIRKYLDLPPKWNEYRIEDLAEKVKKALSVEPDMPNRDFLIQVVKDYNYFASMGV